MKKYASFIALLLLVAYSFDICATIATMTQNDFYPLHSTLYPSEFLNSQHKELEKGTINQAIRERMRFSATVFGQKATRAKDQDKVGIPAGDVRGRWNMLGLLYGNTPTGQTRAALLTTAAGATYEDGQLLNKASYSDVNDNLGHFSIPLKYRKMGARFEFSTRILTDLVIRVEGGLADIKQTHTSLTDKSPLAVTPSDVYPGTAPAGVNATLVTDRATVASNLTDPHKEIFEQMGLNIQDYHSTGVEDAFVSLIWRHNFHINRMNMENDGDYVYEDPDEWEQFILTPFFKLTGIMGIGKEQDQTKAFSLGFGNNGHHGVNLTTGFSIDFYETVEISWEAGTSHFFKRDIPGLFLPTDEQQSGIFPFKTDVSYDPGKTWFFSCGMHARRFVDKLSCHLQYVFTNHSKDSITPITADTAFKPHVLEDQTKWTVQSANVAFNYELSPHMTAGFAWQAPLARRGAYKTNTVAFMLAGTF